MRRARELDVTVHTAADDAELRQLYRGARALLLPSLSEGFGLPVAEAMRCGRAVLTSVGTPMADFGGDAVLAVEPRDPIALSAALERLLREPSLRRDLGAAAAVDQRAGVSRPGHRRDAVAGCPGAPA